MNREEILNSAQYWTAKAQVSLFRLAVEFMQQHNLNRKQLAQYLGVTPGYVTQLLNGDYDHRLSKFFELALAFGKVPEITFTSAVAAPQQVQHRHERSKKQGVPRVPLFRP